MRIFEHGRPIAFGLMVDRLKMHGIYFDGNKGTVEGPFAVEPLCMFSRHHSLGLLTYPWEPMDPEDLVPPTRQRSFARRMAMTPDETDAVFGWTIIPDE
jgi:hypothetical protein